MSEVKKNIIVFLLLLSTLLIIYSPALTTEYIYHDDVNFFLQTPTQKFPKSFHFSLSIGRFIGAPIYAGYSWIVDFMSELNRIRFISIFQFAIIAYLLTSMLKHIIKNRFAAASVAIMITSLPSFQVLATQAGYAFQTTGVLLSILSAYLLNKINVKPSLRHNLLNKYTLGAYVLFILAIATHPSTAMFYWVGAAIIIIRKHNEINSVLIHQIVTVCFTGFASMISYAILLKFLKPLQKSGNYGIYNPYTISTDVFEKAKWFFQEPLVNALNLFNIFPSSNKAILIASIIVLSAIVCLVQKLNTSSSQIRRDTILNFTIIAIILIFFIIMSFVTNLLAVGNAAFYRCTIALTGMILLYLCISVFGLMNVISKKHRNKAYIVISLTGLVICGVHAHQNIKYFRVIPSQVEISYLINSIKRVDLSQYGRVHLIRPNRKKLVNRYDEFGGPTSSFRGDTIGLVSAGIIEALKEKYRIYHIHFDFKTNLASYIFTDMNGEKKAFRIQITSDKKETPIRGSVPTLIIDMTEIFRKSGELSYLRKEL